MGMKRKITCDCCGAPLKRSKCEYCGAEYDTDDFIGIRYEVVNAKTVPLCVRSAVPLELIHKGSEQDIADGFIAKDMARQLADEMVQYMDVETYIEPEHMMQVFNGRVKVVVPKGR